MIFGSKIQGYVQVKVTGSRGAELMNRLAASEIPLWDVAFHDRELSFSVPLPSLSFVRRAALACDCHVTVAGRGGLPFFWKEVRRRRYSWFTALFAAALLCLFLSVSWKVEIVSETGTEPDASLKKEIAAVLKDCGVFPPVLKSAVDTEKTASEILNRCPSLSWAGVSFDGVSMTVSVAPRHSGKTDPVNCGHIVASSDGVIRQVLVLKGQKQVEAGDTVKKGDILISGYLTYEEEGKEPVYDETAAKGVVTASVWYEGTAYVSLEQVVPEFTGNCAGIATLSKGDTSFVLWGSEKNPFTDSVEKNQSFSLFGWELNIKTYREAITRTKKISAEQAKAQAEKKAGNDAQKKWGKNGKLAGREVLELKDVPGAVGVRVILEAEEEIGIFQEVPPR
ncbi:MAG: sporulation protein YqfD [Clostridia bacterium]